jgi:hypothetical protein
MTPGQFQPPDQYPPPGGFAPPGPFAAPGPFPPPGQYPPPAQFPPPGQWVPYAQYDPYLQYGYPGEYLPYRQPGSNPLAIVSLVCGLAQFVVWVLPGIAAIVLGAVALRQIRTSGQDGKGMAIAGIVLGCVGVVLGGLFVVLLIYAIHQAPPANCGSSC